MINWLNFVLSLIRKPDNFAVCCPEHGEKTPSLIIYPRTKRFSCLSCGYSGVLTDQQLEAWQK